MKVLITGATSGIGQATALKLLALGHEVIATGRRVDRLEALKNQVKNPMLTTAVLDVTDSKAVDDFVESHISKGPGLSCLVNNAGLAAGVDSMQNGKIEDWDSMIDTNLKGLLYVTRACLPSLIQSRNGFIVNMGSVAGRWTYPQGGVYCATKFAVRALSEGLRMDLAGTGVRVCNIEPGMVETEFSEVRLKSKEQAQKVYSGMTPLTAQDIAETISWVISRPSHVNIQELVIFPTDQAAVGQVYRR